MLWPLHCENIQNFVIQIQTILLPAVAVIGFAQPYYEIAEGSEGSVQVSLLLNGRQLQRTITVMVFSVDITATGKDHFLSMSHFI